MSRLDAEVTPVMCSIPAMCSATGKLFGRTNFGTDEKGRDWRAVIVYRYGAR